MKLNREYISNIIGDTYKNWNNGDKILINSPCGSGKTRLIKQLVMERKHTGFLIVSNRSNLKKQYWSDLRGCKNFTSICYQSIPKKLKEDKDYLKQFTFIIFDEFHYLLDSANYDGYTDIIFNEITNGDYNKNILIFMSATVGRFKDILKKNFENLKVYEQITTDYNYIDNVSIYKKSNSIIETIANDNSSSKWLIFVSNKKDGEKYKQELTQLGVNCSFIYSEENKKKLSKEVEKIMEEIINDNTFSSKVLVATSILQEGVNLEDKSITNIVMETWTEIETIQSFSRVRVNNENPNRINLFIRKRAKNGVNGKFRTIRKKDELIHNFSKCVKVGKEVEFISEKYDRDTDKFFKDVKPIYYLDKDGSYQMNKLAYIKFLDDYKFYEDLNNNIYDNENYQVNKVLKWFGLEDREIIDLDGVVEEQQEQQQQDILEVWINEHMEQRLFKDDREQLIELIGLRDRRNNRLQKSISILSEYLKEHYNVKLESKRVTVNKKKLTIWEISNME